MQIGVGLDPTLGLNWDEQREVSKEAARLVYTSIWTPEGNGQDSFHLCVQRWQATTGVVSEGLTTGIAVSPVMYRTPLSFAMEGGTVSDITGGKFIMGIGSGGAYRPAARAQLGVGRMSALALMRDYRDGGARTRKRRARDPRRGDHHSEGDASGHAPCPRDSGLSRRTGPQDA